MPIRVLIADDSNAMRAAIARTLKQDPELEVVGETLSGFLVVGAAASSSL
jgi:chemotaxis response regulator CheB